MANDVYGICIALLLGHYVEGVLSMFVLIGLVGLYLSPFVSRRFGDSLAFITVIGWAQEKPKLLHSLSLSTLISFRSQ